MIPASKWGKVEKVEKLELTPEEKQMQELIRASWSAILSLSTVDNQTDFFKSGAGSMDVTRSGEGERKKERKEEREKGGWKEERKRGREEGRKEEGRVERREEGRKGKGRER